MIAQFRTEDSTDLVACYLIIFLVQCFKCRAMDEANACTNLTNLVLAWQTAKHEKGGGAIVVPDSNLLVTRQERRRRRMIDNDHDSGRSEHTARHSMALTCENVLIICKHTASCHAALAALSQSHFRRRASTRTNKGRDTLLHSAYRAEIAQH